MNAVRMSHYPPDPAFLEAADELGLYVLDELAGWQGFYDTPTGARLIGQIVRRDVNHPSILFWDNGNEGGWNTRERRRVRALGSAAAAGAASLGDSRRHQHRSLRELRQHGEAERRARHLHAHGVPARPLRRRHRRRDCATTGR